MSRIFEFKKLIRDKICFDEEIRVQAETLKEEDLQEALLKKLQEEIEEVVSARTLEELEEEIGDVEEVLDGIKHHFGLSVDGIEARKTKKREKRGGFFEGKYIDYVEVPEGHPSISYYTARPEQYREIKKSESYKSQPLA